MSPNPSPGPGRALVLVFCLGAVWFNWPLLRLVESASGSGLSAYLFGGMLAMAAALYALTSRL